LVEERGSSLFEQLERVRSVKRAGLKEYRVPKPLKRMKFPQKKKEEKKKRGIIKMMGLRRFS